MNYEPVIGLEVHCQLATATKMFSACPQEIGAEPNTMVDPYTLGLPGTLPVPNAQAVRWAVKLAVAVGCEVQATSRFARKHYFYPDLPKGYQITQAAFPYAWGGAIETDAVRVRLHHIHIEEDAGKNIHVPGEDVSLVDYNRAGAPLLEIVSEPDLRSAADAADYLRELRAIVRTLGISAANMEEGTLRCDANVSLRPVGREAFGTRCEIKNLNSFRFLERAIEAEIRRQTDLLDAGEAVVMATMTYDADRDATRIMRTKEEAADYRYLPEPDLPPLSIPNAWIEDAKATMPELPAARRARYRDAGLPEQDAIHFAAEPDVGDHFDEAIATGAPAALTASLLTSGTLARLGGAPIAETRVSSGSLGEIAKMVGDDTLSLRAGKQLFGAAWDEDGEPDPRQLADRLGLRQVSDVGVLQTAIAEILAASPKQIEQYRAGKTSLKGYFVGQVMKKTRGQANPKLVSDLLDAALAEGKPG